MTRRIGTMGSVRSYQRRTRAGCASRMSRTASTKTANSAAFFFSLIFGVRYRALVGPAKNVTLSANPNSQLLALANLKCGLIVRRMRHDSGRCGERCGRNRGPDLLGHKPRTNTSRFWASTNPISQARISRKIRLRILGPQKASPTETHPLLRVASQKARRYSCHYLKTLSGSNVLLTSPTRRAPVQPARPTACSR